MFFSPKQQPPNPPTLSSFFCILNTLQSNSPGTSTVNANITSMSTSTQMIPTSSNLPFEAKFNPQTNKLNRKRPGRSKSFYKGKAAKVMVAKEESRRLVALEFPGEDVPEVDVFNDDKIIFDGLLKYFSNDTGPIIRQKITSKLRERKVSDVDLTTCGPQDFEFVKVVNKKIRIPDGEMEFDAQTIRGILRVVPSMCV